MNNWDDQNEADELTAINAALGGLPPGFERQSPDYQRAWLKRKIPVLQKEIADEEAELNTHKQSRVQRDLHRQPLQDKYIADLGRWAHDVDLPFPKAPPGGGFLDMLGDVFNELGGASAFAQLDAKKKILMDLEARYDALQGPPPAPKPIPPPTSKQQREQVLDEIADMLKEKADAIAKMSRVTNDPTILQGIAAGYDDRVQKLKDKLSKI